MVTQLMCGHVTIKNCINNYIITVISSMNIGWSVSPDYPHCFSPTFLSPPPPSPLFPLHTNANRPSIMVSLVLAPLLRSSPWCSIQAPPTSGFPPANALSSTLLAVSCLYSFYSGALFMLRLVQALFLCYDIPHFN